MSQMTRRQLLEAAGLTAGALALPRPARAQAPKSGGTLISAQTSEATGLDPQLVPALSRSRRSPLTYNQLVRFEPDMTPVPELAESWQVSPDGLTWTFKLRQGVKFHDGQEFTSADVKFTFDRCSRSPPPASRTSSPSTRWSRPASTPSSSSPRSRSRPWWPRWAASGGSSSARRG